MRLGPLYFDSKEAFLLIAAIFVGLSVMFGIKIFLFDRTALFTIIIIFLLTKGLLPSIHNEAFFFLATTTVILTIFFSMLQVILFYFITFAIFRLLKVI